MFDPATQRVRRTWAFVMTLSWSRHQYVEFVFDQSVPTWLMLHQHAFDFFAGVPRRIVLDNLKTAITYADRDEPAVQRAYRDLAEHYGFLIAPCRVATPQHKGKVENGVHYVQRNFLAGRHYTDVHQDVRRANQDVRDWIKTTAGQRRHGTTKQSPLERFIKVEWQALLPVPAERYEEVVWKQTKLHRDCHVTFDNAYYSAPFRCVGDTLWVRATPTVVQLYIDFELVATHTRATQAGQRRTEDAHLPSEKVEGLRLTPDRCRARAEQIGVCCREVVEVLLLERPVDRLRAVQHLLHLAERYTPERLERACARMLRFDETSVRTIRRILEQGLDGQPLDAPTPSAPAEAAPYWPRFARRPEEIVPPAPAGPRAPDVEGE
jgi:hypothetical protein